MSEVVTITLGDRTVCVPKGTLFSEIFKGEMPCGGHGKCGKCKIKTEGAFSPPSEQEKEFLSEEEITAGIRLACLTRATADCRIERIWESRQDVIVTHGRLPVSAPSPIFSAYGAAIDLGTTTLAARLYAADGRLLAESAALNPQSQWGADVISRIECAMAGKADLLADAIRRALDRLLAELAAQAAVAPTEIDAICITGNTAMLSLLCKEDVEPLSHAPFAAKRLFGEVLPAGELAFSSVLPETPVYLPRCIAAFVGADIVTALLGSGIENRETALLVDIGTNGEMALWHKGELTVASTAAGPAFEGVGITMGMRGAVGAIDKVFLENGRIKVHVIGETTPSGICGSGLIDAIACMLESEVIDESGYLEEDEFVIASPVLLTPKDVRMVQLAKSAVCAGILSLLKKSSVEPDEISALYIAGGFGNYLNMKSAESIGLLPADLTKKVCCIGNAALDGAAMLLLDKSLTLSPETLLKKVSVLDLSTNAVFSEYYIDGMTFGTINC